MRRLLPPLIALALLTTACGTTVAGSTVGAGGTAVGFPQADAGLDPAAAGDELTAPGSALAAGGSAGAPGLASVPDEAGAPRSAEGPGVGRGATGTTGGGSSTSTGSTGSRAPRDTSPVKVGVLYVQDGGAAAERVGVRGLSTGNAKAQAEAVFGWVGKNGGLAGRPVHAHYYGIKAEDAISRADAAFQEACVAFTQDMKVSYVVSYLNTGENFLACLAEKGVGLIDDAASVLDTIMDEYKRYVASPGDLAPGRKQVVLGNALVRTGWLTKRSVVGVYVPDTPATQAMADKYLKPTLAKHGIGIKLKHSGNSDAAVLAFKSAGVDRIIPIEISPILLMNSAESQGYRPRYAVQSGWGPGALLEVAAPRNQLVGSAGIGWSPYLDIGRGKRPPPVSDNEALCFRIYAENGQSSAEGTTKALSLQLCSVILYLKAAADRVGSVTTDLLPTAAAALGSSWRPADTFRSDMSRGRTDGVSAFHDLVYDSGCSCYQYVGPLRPTG